MKVIFLFWSFNNIFIVNTRTIAVFCMSFICMELMVYLFVWEFVWCLSRTWNWVRPILLESCLFIQNHQDPSSFIFKSDLKERSICDFCISTHSFDWILFILQIIFNLHGVEEFLLKVQFHWSHLNTFLFAAFNTRSFGNFSFMSVRIQFFLSFSSEVILFYLISSSRVTSLT